MAKQIYMRENAHLTDMKKNTKRERGLDRGKKGEKGITMSIVPLGETIMTDKMRLLKRTQWPLIDSLGEEENELMSGERVLRLNCWVSKTESHLLY